MTDESTQTILCLSLGENCLPDDILKRHGVKSISTPYSSGRTNIDYALTLEKNNYSDLLNIENLVFGDAWGAKVVRSRHIIDAEDIFDPSCSKGFEFTHHNPIESIKDRESILRKINRIQSVKGTENILFLYHHRYTSKSDLNKLREKIKNFREYYTNELVKCYVGLFYQKEINDKSERKLEFHITDKTMMEFIFHTEHRWEGDDESIFWAKNDDDLIKEMLDSLNKHIHSS